MTSPHASSPAPEELLAESESLLGASEEALRQQDLLAAAPLAFDALRAALWAARGRRSLPAARGTSLLSAAEELGRAANLGCLATKLAPLLCLGLDLRDAPRDRARLSRLVPAAHEVIRNLQTLAGASPRPPGRDGGGRP